MKRNFNRVSWDWEDWEDWEDWKEKEESPHRPEHAGLLRGCHTLTFSIWLSMLLHSRAGGSSLRLTHRQPGPVWTFASG